MLSKLFLLFILVPLVELTLLLLLGNYTDWWVSVMVVVVSGIVGAILARQQGMQTYRRVHQELSQGKMPTDALLDGLLILIAGALLLTPGLITDAFGMTLLVAPLRVIYKAQLVLWFKRNVKMSSLASSAGFGNNRSEVIDSYVVDSTESREDNDS